MAYQPRYNHAIEFGFTPHLLGKLGQALSLRSGRVMGQPASKTNNEIVSVTGSGNTVMDANKVFAFIDHAQIFLRILQYGPESSAEYSAFAGSRRVRDQCRRNNYAQRALNFCFF